MSSSVELLGVGLYTIPEAARLLRIPPARLRRWASGYCFQGRGGQHLSAPVISRDLREWKDELTLTFLDLIELHLVDLLRGEGVTMPTIRAAAQMAGQMLGSEHPFAMKGLMTDDKSIFAAIEPGTIDGVSPGRAVMELDRGQYVVESLAQPFLRNLDYDPDIAARWWPLGRERRIVVDPHRSFGRPMDADTGVPTSALYLMKEGGEPADRIARWYDVPVETVSRAVEFEEQLQKAA